MFPVEHLDPKVFMAEYYFVDQLACMLGWVALACLKKESETPHLGACWFSLQYDRRVDFGCRFVCRM